MDTVTPAAGQFWSDRFDNPEGCVNDIQLFGETFAQWLQPAAAGRALGFLWLDNLTFAGKCCR